MHFWHVVHNIASSFGSPWCLLYLCVLFPDQVVAVQLRMPHVQYNYYNPILIVCTEEFLKYVPFTYKRWVKIRDIWRKMLLYCSFLCFHQYASESFWSLIFYPVVQPSSILSFYSYGGIFTWHFTILETTNKTFSATLLPLKIFASDTGSSSFLCLYVKRNNSLDNTHSYQNRALLLLVAF